MAYLLENARNFASNSLKVGYSELILRTPLATEITIDKNNDQIVAPYLI